jgi:hypothetical protein
VLTKNQIPTFISEKELLSSLKLTLNNLTLNSEYDFFGLFIQFIKQIFFKSIRQFGEESVVLMETMAQLLLDLELTSLLDISVLPLEFSSSQIETFEIKTNSLLFYLNFENI